jgi:hypothetical protein
MFRLPFLKKSKSPDISEGFLGITLNSYKVTVLYFKKPEGLPNDSEEASLGVEESPCPLEIITAESRFVTSDSLYEGDCEQRIKSTLADILVSMEEDYGDLPDQAIFGISPDHCLDLMSVVRFTHPERTKFTEEELENLQEQAEKNASFRAQDLLASIKGDMDTDLIRITAAQVSLVMDEASINDPVGLEGEKLELSWFGSFAEESYLDFVQHVASESGLEILAVTSAGYSLYSVLQDSSPTYNNSVIINFDSHSTEVFVSFGGGLVGTRSINMGIAGFISDVAKKMDLHFDEAVEMVEKYKKGSLDPTLVAKVQKTLDKFLVVWEKALVSVFSDFSGVKTFSSKVVLAGEGFEFPDVRAFLEDEPWYKSIPFKAPPVFEEPLVVDLMPSVSDISGKASSLTWSVPVSLSSIYFKVEEQ